MHIFLLFITIILATVLEWSLAGKVDFLGIPIPFAVSAVIFWFWRAPFVFRIWLAVLAGIFFDTLSLHPWGLFILSFCIAALATEFLQRIFTPTFRYGSGFALPVLAKLGFTRIDSIFSQIVGTGAGIFIVLFSVFLGGLWVEYGISSFSQLSVASLGSAPISFIFWAILIPFCIFVGLALGKKFKMFA